MINNDIIDLVNNKFDGEKIIFMVFTSARGGCNRKKILAEGLDYIDSGFYDIGDAGFDSELFAKKVTHQELVEIARKFKDMKDSQTYLVDWFEYCGWNFILPTYDDDNDDYDSYSPGAEDLDSILNESESKIYEYLRNCLLIK